MQPLTLLATLRDRGADVRADGNRLRIKPASVARDLDSEIREHVPALLELLRTRAPAESADARTEPPLEIETATYRTLDAGAAYDRHHAARHHAARPPALNHELPRPAFDAAAGLWMRPDGCVVVTRDTLPAVVAHCAKRQAAKRAREVKAA